MNFKVIVDKLKPSKSNGNTQVVMLGNDAVYISSSEQASQVTSIPFVNGDWESALKKSLNSEAFTSNSLQLIVCANYYQTYQLDKPDIPETPREQVRLWLRMGDSKPSKKTGESVPWALNPVY